MPGFGIPVFAAQFSPNGHYLATQYERGQRHNYVWDLNRREAILKQSQGTYYSFPSFSPDSRLVALARPDRSIRVYKLPSGTTWKDLAPGLPAQAGDATNRTFEDHWVFDIAVRNGKVTNIREYIDTQALARASEMDASPRP